MIDVAQENAFVEAFILSERRERYRQLLGNPKRRKDILTRFHHALDYIPALARKIPNNQYSAEGVLRLLSEYGMRETDSVYIVSAARELDGLQLPLRQALEEVIQAGVGSVVCCRIGTLAYYRPEAPASGYILDKP